MARIRTIKPEFWRHEELSELPEATHMLAAQLLNYADDDGYFNANPRLIKAECSPLREPSVSVQDSLRTLSDIGYLELGTGDDGKRYGRITTFSDHQRINRPTESKIKKIHIVWDDSPESHAQLSEQSQPEGNGREPGKEQGAGNREGAREMRVDIDEEFISTFWPLVPKKQGKDDAMKAYKAARKKASAADLAEGMRRYALSVAGKDPEYIKMPAGWLRSGRWMDEAPPPKQPDRLDVILGARDDFSASVHARSHRPDHPGDHEQLSAPEHHQES